MAESILFLTGHLAKSRLEAVLSAMNDAGFDWKVLDIGVKVAALMTEDIILRRLPKPIAQAISAANLQITQNQQAQAISENIAAQRQAAGVLQSVDQDVMALPITGVHQTIRWGQ